MKRDEKRCGLKFCVSSWLLVWVVASLLLTETTIPERYREFIMQLVRYRMKPNGIVV
jgi:hypothetical protein